MLATADVIRKQARRLERWERLARGEDADRIAQWVIARRAAYGLGLADVRKLDRWIDSVWLAPIGVGAGGVIAATSSLTPVDVLGGSAIVGWFLSTQSTITVATGVSNWSPTFGASPVFAQATGGQQPLYTANDSTLYGRGSFLGDGADDFLNSTVDLPAGTIPTYMRFVLKQVVWTAGTYFCGGSSANTIGASGLTPQLRLVAASGNTSSNNGGATIGSWARVEALSYIGAYFFKCGATEFTGTFALATDAVANWAICARSAGGTGANYSNIAISELLLATGSTPTALQRALLDGITNRYYKGAVLL
jgi:hypothetical protein